MLSAVLQVDPITAETATDVVVVVAAAAGLFPCHDDRRS